MAPDAPSGPEPEAELDANPAVRAVRAALDSVRVLGAAVQRDRPGEEDGGGDGQGSEAPAAQAPSGEDATAGAPPVEVVPDEAPREVPAAAALTEAMGRARPVICGVRPSVDGGRLPAKAAEGEVVTVEADVFADGHDQLLCEVRYRHRDERGWTAVPMAAVGDDRWRAQIPITVAGRISFAVWATIDRFGSWSSDVHVKSAAGQDIAADLLVGAELLAATARRVEGDDAHTLRSAGERLRAASEAAASGNPAPGVELAGDTDLADLVRRYPDPRPAAVSDVHPLLAERARARFSSWYELFPRSTSPEPGRAGTLADVIDRLPYVASMGFDVLYLPPIHPIGVTKRKGVDGAADARPGDPGSPWAIGSADGGHTAVDPALGTVADVERLVAAARTHDIEVALDLAFQCSPDHPWVLEHPHWFRRLPDGTVRPAENPPKRYDDVYPIDFETDDWRTLWQALRDVVVTWVGRGIRIFRVDNPHTKPLRFWRWLIASVQEDHPDVLFLSEAFTRPRVMEQLAKFGFTQSYTYFTWRTTKGELEQYLTELTSDPVAAYLRPNFWPNTPDILPETLQHGGRPAFLGRLVLAATLAASYGIYGPVFELQEHLPRSPGSEEYLGSEKYTVRHWDLQREDSLAGFIARVNEVRRAHRALQHDQSLRFHPVDGDQLIAYSKTAPPPGVPLGSDGAVGDRILVVVNLDTTKTTSGWVHLDLDALGLRHDEPFEVHDQLTDARYRWQGPHNYVSLDPGVVPAHLFVVRRIGDDPETRS